MRAWPLLTFACGAMALAACVLEADGFADGKPVADAGSVPEAGPLPELEAGTPDAAMGTGTPDAGPDAEADGGDAGGIDLVNVLVNGDFENGCASWTPSDPANVVLTESTDSHSGGKSCRACMNVADNTYVFQAVNMSVPAGGRTFGQIFIRGAQANPPGNAIQFLLNYDPTTNGDDDDDSPSSYAQPNAGTWTRMSMVQEVYDNAKQITIVVGLNGNANKCVLLDDAAMALVPDE